MVTLTEYQSICAHLKEPEEEWNKEIFFTEEQEECEEGLDDGEMLVVRRALSGLDAPEKGGYLSHEMHYWRESLLPDY